MKAGDDVRVSGIVKTRWQANKMNERCRYVKFTSIAFHKNLRFFFVLGSVELVMHGTYVEVTNEQKFAKAALDEETIESFKA